MPIFFHLINTYEDERLTNVFWMHPQSIAAYEELCNVVIVDITYFVKRYRMPLLALSK